MKKMDNLVGGVGLLVTIAALIWYSITRVWDIYHWILIVIGIAGLGDLINADPKEIAKEIHGVGPKTAAEWIQAAKAALVLEAN